MDPVFAKIVEVKSPLRKGCSMLPFNQLDRKSRSQLMQAMFLMITIKLTTSYCFDQKRQKVVSFGCELSKLTTSDSKPSFWVSTEQFIGFKRDNSGFQDIICDFKNRKNMLIFGEFSGVIFCPTFYIYFPTTFRLKNTGFLDMPLGQKQGKIIECFVFKYIKSS